jgi:isopenicillin N synthase-like dioxygenase
MQAQLPDGDWLPVPLVPGALQVFSGSLLTRWTNGRLRPARHRVVAGGTRKRRSVAIFYYPGLEQVLEPLAPFVEPGEETDYEPVTQLSRPGRHRRRAGDRAGWWRCTRSGAGPGPAGSAPRGR